MTDASIKRLLKEIMEEAESKGSSSMLGSTRAVEVYKRWIKNEQEHNGNQWQDYRSANILMQLFDKLDNTYEIGGLKAGSPKRVYYAYFKRDLLIGILYDWQRKTIVIDKLHNAQNQLAELVS